MVMTSKITGIRNQDPESVMECLRPEAQGRSSASLASSSSPTSPVGLATCLFHDLAAEEPLDGLWLLLSVLRSSIAWGLAAIAATTAAAITSRSETIW